MKQSNLKYNVGGIFLFGWWVFVHFVMCSIVHKR